MEGEIFKRNDGQKTGKLIKTESGKYYDPIHENLYWNGKLVTTNPDYNGNFDLVFNDLKIANKQYRGIAFCLCDECEKYRNELSDYPLLKSTRRLIAIINNKKINPFLEDKYAFSLTIDNLEDLFLDCFNYLSMYDEEKLTTDDYGLFAELFDEDDEDDTISFNPAKLFNLYFIDYIDIINRNDAIGNDLKSKLDKLNQQELLDTVFALIGKLAIKHVYLSFNYENELIQRLDMLSIDTLQLLVEGLIAMNSQHLTYETDRNNPKHLELLIKKK